MERQGVAMKVAKWLASSQCNGSAVVSPLPIDRSSSASPGNISKRSAEKILELLGPENRDEQRQIHELLKKLQHKGNDEDDSNPTSDDESEETSSVEYWSGDTGSTSNTPRSSYLLPKATGYEGFPVPCRGAVHLTGYACKAPSKQLNNGSVSPLMLESRHHHLVRRSFHEVLQQHTSPVTRPGKASAEPSCRHYSGRNQVYFQSPRHTPVCSPPRLSAAGFAVCEEPLRYFQSPRHTPGCSPPRLSAGFAVYEEALRYCDVYSQSPFLSPRQASPHHFLGASPSPMPSFVLGDKLGSGSYGTVYKSKDLRTGKEVALKVLHNDEALCPQEVAVLCRLNHKHVVQYFGTTTLTDGRSCIILELMSCSLASLLKDGKGLDENTIRRYTRQVLRGLEYLHAKQIVHRDIKCANILLDRRGTAKLSDFGDSKKIGLSMAKSCKGTLSYMAPEVLLSVNCGAKYGLPADIWSLGCMLIEMASSRPPWSGLSMFETMIKVKEGDYPPIPRCLSPDAVSFIRSCLKKDPKRRPTASSLLQHAFLNCT